MASASSVVSRRLQTRLLNASNCDGTACTTQEEDWQVLKKHTPHIATSRNTWHSHASGFGTRGLRRVIKLTTETTWKLGPEEVVLRAPFGKRVGKSTKMHREGRDIKIYSRRTRQSHCGASNAKCPQLHLEYELRNHYLVWCVVSASRLANTGGKKTDKMTMTIIPGCDHVGPVSELRNLSSAASPGAHWRVPLLQFRVPLRQRER